MRSDLNNMPFVKYAFAALLCVLMSAAESCTDNSNNPVTPGTTSTVDGYVSGGEGLAKVESDSSAGGTVQGATVTLAEIQVDGSLKTVSSNAVETVANGHFSIKTNLDGVNDLVAVASKASGQWESIVSAEVRNGATVYCQPLTDQTTVQAQAYSKIIADGKGSEITPADLQLFVNRALGANLSASASEIAQLATALEDESEARLTAFNQLNITKVQLQSADAARQQAQVGLEAALYSADGDSAADDAALKTYYAATVGAYVAAGIPIEAVAKVEEVSCSALENFSSDMSQGAQFYIQQSAELVRAAAVGQAVLAELQTGGASQTQIASADSANTALAAGLALAFSSKDISAALAGYHSSIMAQLENMDAADSSTISATDAEIEGSGGPFALLRTSLSTAATTGAVVQAYMTFYGSIGSMMQGMAGMSGSQLDATTQIIMLVDGDM